VLGLTTVPQEYQDLVGIITLGALCFFIVQGYEIPKEKISEILENRKIKKALSSLSEKEYVIIGDCFARGEHTIYLEEGLPERFTLVSKGLLERDYGFAKRDNKLPHEIPWKVWGILEKQGIDFFKRSAGED